MPTPRTRYERWAGLYHKWRFSRLGPLVAEAAGDLQQFVGGELEGVLGCSTGVQ